MVADHDLGELLVFRAGKPLRRRVAVVLELGAIPRRGLGFGFGALLIKDSMLLGSKGLRLGNVGGPLATLRFRQFREQLVGEHRKGLFGGQR